MENTLAMILAGGTGQRLFPLTMHRAKPAVPFGGKYRIIDFCLANCLHSGIRKILVLTQYKSHSLHKHLRDGWSIFNPELGEFITAVPPQMRTGDDWYQGTADAIHQNMYLMERNRADYILILSADHIYRMDYAAMLEAHIKANADVTIASMEVSVEEGKNFGIMSIDEQQQVKGFREKPVNPDTIPGDSKKCLASMGIYIFNKFFLLDTLRADNLDAHSSHDFGKDIIPELIKTKKVLSYRFGGHTGRVTQDAYWRDVGTIDSFYQANMDLLKAKPPLDLYQKDWPIRSYQRQTPPARTAPGESGTEGICINSIVAGGVVISGGSVQQSVLFPNVTILDEAFVVDSILFSGVKIGKGAQIQNAIIDKGVVIPAGMKIGFDAKKDAALFTISEKGVVVISVDTKLD